MTEFYGSKNLDIPLTTWSKSFVLLLVCFHLYLWMITRKARVLKSILRLFYLLPSGLFLLTIVQNVKDTSQFVVSDPTFVGIGKKDFIYLVQAEECLPDHLLHPHRLGSGVNRDVIVLSWKRRCKNTSSSLPHIKYVFRNNTSWGSGRNLLYHLARARRNGYLFYSFMDEDIEFQFTNDIPKEHIYNKTSASPLQVFENFLRGHEPAVGLTNFCSVCGKILPKGSYVSSLCCSSKPKGDLPLIFPASISFDAGFNAFHRDAIDHILPYNLQYEDTSWWESQKYIILTADLLFRGQVLRYLPVSVTNTKHRPYPKANLKNWKEILHRLRDNVPNNLRNIEHFDQEPIPDMDFNITDNILFTPRWNITIAGPKEPIVPYRHFQML